MYILSTNQSDISLRDSSDKDAPNGSSDYLEDEVEAYRMQDESDTEDTDTSSNMYDPEEMDEF